MQRFFNLLNVQFPQFFTVSLINTPSFHSSKNNCIWLLQQYLPMRSFRNFRGHQTLCVPTIFRLADVWVRIPPHLLQCYSSFVALQCGHEYPRSSAVSATPVLDNSYLVEILAFPSVPCDPVECFCVCTDRPTPYSTVELPAMPRISLLSL